VTLSKGNRTARLKNGTIHRYHQHQHQHIWPRGRVEKIISPDVAYCLELWAGAGPRGDAFILWEIKTEIFSLGYRGGGRKCTHETWRGAIPRRIRTGGRAANGNMGIGGLYGNAVMNGLPLIYRAPLKV